MLKTSCEECPGRLIGLRKVVNVEGPDTETKQVVVTWIILQYCEACGKAYWTPEERITHTALV